MSLSIGDGGKGYDAGTEVHDLSDKARTAQANLVSGDIAFVINSTGSMRDDVDAVRNKVSTIVDRVKKSASGCRFALVDYKDHPTFDSENYLARTQPDFTSDPTALDAALGSLTY